MTLPIRFRQTWLPLVIGAVGGLIAWLLGVIPPDAALIGLLVVVGLLVPRWIGHPGELGPPTGTTETSATGNWYEVRRLGTLLRRSHERRDVFVTRIRPRLRTVAERRLTRLGVRWEEPAARRLLGPDVHDLLDGSSLPPTAAGRSPLTLTELVLGRIDEIPETRGDRQEGAG